MRLTVVLFSVIALTLAALVSAFAQESRRLENLYAPLKRRAVPPLALPGLVVDGVNQLWVAGIAHIPFCDDFLYLAVILDAHSRQLVGWQVGDIPESSLALAALKRALAQHSVQPGIVHHSERGEPYASQDYLALLQENGFVISMCNRRRAGKAVGPKAAVAC